MYRFMLRQLYSLGSFSSCPDNPDSPQHQEVLLPGSLYGMILKERLDEALNQIGQQISADVRRGETSFSFEQGKYTFAITMS